MVKTKTTYEGGLHCSMVHEPSGATLSTDAPVDNNGKGESFSPTDLVGAALAGCMSTIITVPLPSDYPDRKLLEQAALSCPVKHSLHPDIEIPITWKWVG